jgi:hypothetical protein
MLFWARLARLTVLAIFMVSCSTTNGQNEGPNGAGLDEKYADYPYVEGQGAASPQPTDLPFGTPQVEVIDVPGEYGRLFRFTKRANRRYRVSLSQLTGDLDIFGHWTTKVNRRNRHEEHFSYEYNTTDEEFFIDSTKDGEYFIRAQAFNGGQGGQGVLLLEDVTAGSDNPGNPPATPSRALILSVSGHDFAIEGLAACEVNPEYLETRGTINALAATIRSAGGYETVDINYYSDNFYDDTNQDRLILPTTALDAGERRENWGFLHLLDDLDDLRSTPAGMRPDLYMVGHSHGTVWAHIALFLLQSLPADPPLRFRVLIDLDGESLCWSRPCLTAGDCWVNTIKAYVRENEPVWAFNPSDAAQSFGDDIEDLVPENVDYNIEIASGARFVGGEGGAPNLIGVQDGEPNRRHSDDSTRGIFRFEIDDETHGEVTFPDSVGIATVKSRLSRLLGSSGR